MQARNNAESYLAEKDRLRSGERYSKIAGKRASPKLKSDHVFGQRSKQPKMFRAGLYARVSTKGQRTLPMQSRATREYVVRRGWTITLHVREDGFSAAKREARGESWRRRAAGTLMQSRMATGPMRPVSHRPTGNPSRTVHLTIK